MHSRTAVRLLCFVACLTWTALAGSAEPRLHDPIARHQSFDHNWRFVRGDPPGAERSTFDDAHWIPLRLPHDWAIEGPFDAKLNPQTGALPVAGVGWYRKAFTLPLSERGRDVTVEFDGAMSNAQVWLNGVKLGEHPYGYIGFGFDLTAHLRFGRGLNVLAVRLAPEPDSSRWYPGAGLYRNVWLNVTGPVHVARWGTFITTPEVALEQATVSVRTELRNERSAPARVELRTAIVDQAGLRLASVRTPLQIPANGAAAASLSLRLPHPQRWDVEHPYLYAVISEVIESGRVVDRYESPFGVRSVAFDKQRGLLLNGRSVRLHGVCLHHDLGALGAAVSRRATERQLQILKAAGVNAVRTSHNPPSPELLEFADRLGILVLDEAFDMWRIPKVPNGYSKYFDAWSERDLRDMVRRDRNHPSIIMWSIGNEVPEQGQADGWKQARRLSRLIHEEDPTRPTTAGFNQWQDAIGNKLADEVDIPGFNYAPNHYQEILRDHPDWIIYGSETASCVSSRGVYHLPLQKYDKHPSLQLSSYDLIAPSWAYCPDVEFDAQERVPQVLGEFVWTGFDYLGEPTPFFGWQEDNSHDWPARSSYFGMVDLAGFPKDRYFLYQSAWTQAPMVHVLPHWNWPGREGQLIPVMVYTNTEAVELFLNGKSLGSKRALTERIQLPVGRNVSPTETFSSKYRLLWQVPYAPGILSASARRGGQEVARAEIRTAGPAASIRLRADRAQIAADGDDLAFITARIEDRSGNLVPTAAQLLTFHVSGPGTIAAVDNGNAASLEPFHADHRQAFNGLALLIVRSRAGHGGRLNITARSDGLVQGSTTVTTSTRLSGP